ncbi:hypothetical protein VNI00_015242 [Paramarasmius palmivorus]|uniref:Protein kinase domain-containing protein n=1 Tax=Paramarasmius palmivorus TaxID=297713 RepID=A0AAW0BME8_9AGAR
MSVEVNPLSFLSIRILQQFRRKQELRCQDYQQGRGPASDSSQLDANANVHINQQNPISESSENRDSQTITVNDSDEDVTTNHQSSTEPHESMSYESQINILHLLLQNDTLLLDQQGTLAQSLLDWLQQLIDAPGVTQSLRTSICTTMRRLSEKNGISPSCLTIKGITKLAPGKDPKVASDGFGDIWKGHLGDSEDQFVLCLKVVKVHLMSDMKRLLNEYLREAITWRQLRHPNILPCLGLYYLRVENTQRLCLISPWMEDGNLVEFLKTQPPETVNRIQLMHDITNGVSHLHALGIVHGDLKDVNILITPSHRACITDIGLSRVADSQIYKLTSTATHAVGSSTRWSAPEIILTGGPSSASTTWSDIYSVGCLFYQITTGLIPFHHLSNEGMVFLAVLRGKRPLRPGLGTLHSDALWTLMNDCWNSDPMARPTAEDILRRLPMPATDTAPGDWDDRLFIEFHKNVECTGMVDREALEFLERVGGTG